MNTGFPGPLRSAPSAHFQQMQLTGTRICSTDEGDVDRFRHSERLTSFCVAVRKFLVNENHAIGEKQCVASLDLGGLLHRKCPT